MLNKILINAQPNKVQKFYFLEYFYVLLKSVQLYSQEDRIFEYFLDLKQQKQLGESKYKKSAYMDKEFSPNQMVHFTYTFREVLTETEGYSLVKRTLPNFIYLTDLGEQAIEIYEEQGVIEFNKFLFRLMERKYFAFEYLLDVCYSANPAKYGLLVFPLYSPYRLGFERSSIVTSRDFIEYFRVLQEKLESDIQKHLEKVISLDEENETLIRGLVDAKILPEDLSQPFEASQYNVIVKRGRDFWLNYFLKLYNYQFSLHSFDIWAYRGKQIGILHITEFYPDPNFSGRIVYPMSVILESSNSKDFEELFVYQDNQRLYLHNPSWESMQDDFVKSLVDAYFDLRKSAKSYFINLWNVRELVCYNLKIPTYLFDQFLAEAYRLSFGGDIPIRISLEVDKLSQETNAMYLKRTPVMIDGKDRNIIAIDLTKEGRRYERVR